MDTPFSTLVRLIVARLHEARSARRQEEMDRRVVARILLALVSV